MKFHFHKEQLSDFDANIRREWAMTNGIGGYAGGSVTGACCRTHQGYLVASLHAPTERYLILSRTLERFAQGGQTYSLETTQRKNGVCTDGLSYLTDFIYDGNVTFVYQAGDLSIRKQLALVHGQNTVAVDYEITNAGPDAEFTITPLLNYREHSSLSTKDDLRFTLEETVKAPSGWHYGFITQPEKNPNVHIGIAFSDGKMHRRSHVYDENTQYQLEVDNETDGLDCHYTPCDISFVVPAKKRMHYSFICTAIVEPHRFGRAGSGKTTARILADARRQYLQRITAQAGYTDEFACALVVAADQFLAHRESTGFTTVLAGLPWFTDWGRDTMLAFSGLTLATKRFTEAREILLTFAQYVKNGLIPNMFPDDGQKPLYNTADASLWYFYAVDQYLRYTGEDRDYDFIRNKIYPALLAILNAYQNGTDFSICMDADGLIRAGSGLDQVTWMDVRVGDWVATPRHGKPVEINALWYNALMVMAKLAERFGGDVEDCLALAKKVQASFLAQFWNEENQCLYDVVDDAGKDASIRPNQLYAVSLPYTMLSDDQAKKVVDTVQAKLLAGPGIRSLDPDHKDYHGVYQGALQKRDEAYHQGTAWGFLMGAFVSAYVKVNGRTEQAKEQARAFLEPVKAHLYDGCIGSISEIFDGDSPHTCRGCYAQAWSVGEVLRCYAEDILAAD